MLVFHGQRRKHKPGTTMSSRLSIQHFISPTEPTGVQVGDEWYNPTTSILQKRTLVSGVISWSPVLTSNVQNSSLANSAVTINGTSIPLGSTGSLSNLPNSSLANSTVTINGTSIQLGSSVTLAAGATITDDTATNATRYIMLGTSSSGSYTIANTSSTKLYSNPSTGTTYSTLFR